LKYAEIYVGKIPDQQVRQAIQQFFEVNKFKLKWIDQYSGKATRGSKGENIVLGALSPYYEIDFHIFTLPDKTITIRLIKSTSGWLGGAIGAYRVKKKYQEIVEKMSSYFYSMETHKERVHTTRKKNTKIRQSEIVFCPNCGAQLPEEINFCPNCGQKLMK